MTAGLGCREVLNWAAALGVAGVLVLAALRPASGAEGWGWLGVRIRDLAEAEMEDLTAKLGFSEGSGVMVAEILKDTPAEAAGLKAGDLIVAIAGRPVVETRALQRIVGGSPPGRELAVVVLREGRRREIRVRVGPMPPDAVAERVAAEFGFLVRDPVPEDQASGTPARSPIVAAVAERSAAARGGLRVSDRIVALNGLDVASVEAFRRGLQEVLLLDELRLSVSRQGETIRLVLPPAQVKPVN